MKIFLSLLISFFFVSIAKAETQFFETLYDIPKMSQMVEYSGEGFLFDKADGRLATAKASIEESPEEIIDFYKTALYQMGWAQINQKPNFISFIRKNEKITISIEKTEAYEVSGNIVSFEISPLAQ
ncbi:MAG: hypothetical protein AAF549_03770 [Pseudomonadota bacterium]